MTADDVPESDNYPEDWWLALRYALACEWDEEEMERVFKALGLKE